MIEIKNITKTFGEQTIINDLSLTLRQDHVTAIIGPSGSGKSTLLRCINNLEKIQNGSISIFDQDLVRDGQYSKKALQKKIESDMTMVFQHFNLFPHLSVLGNIMLPQTVVRKRTKQEAKGKAISLLEQFGLVDLADKYPNQLSGGQKQRVAIVRSLAIDPKLILFDEPTSALDPELVNEVLDAIRRLKETDVSIVLVTHEMDFVRDIADRVIFLDQGKVLEDGTVEDVFDNSKSDRVRNFTNKLR